VSEHKHIGLMLNDRFTWSNHVDYLCKKASKLIGLFYKNRKTFSRLTLNKLYNSMLKPVIEYGSVVYDNMTLHDSARLENLQRRVALICTGAQPRTESQKLMLDLGWLSLKTRREIAKLLIFYKIVNKLVPNYLYLDLSKFKSSSVKRFTRSSAKNIFRPLKKKNLLIYYNSFFPATVRLWNALAEETRRLDSFSKFKKYLHHKFDYDEIVRFFDYNAVDIGGNKLLAQMRMGLSDLRLHQFRYNLTDNPFCQFCLEEVESVEHYFLKCNHHHNESLMLMGKLSLYIDDIAKLTNSEIVDICLRGSSKFDFGTNYNIIRNAILFVLSTKRFVS
jgi:hypothetical protein